MKVIQFFERLRLYPDWDKDLLIENKETKMLEDIKDIVCDERNGNLIIEKMENATRPIEDVTPIKIILQDRDNYGEILGVLEVKDANSKSPMDTVETVEKFFEAYKSDKEDCWTVEGFIEELKKKENLEVVFDADEFDVEL